MAITALIRLARPKQWIKNIVVILPVLFGREMTQPQSWTRAIVAAAAFCLASSVSYIVNDIRDASKDRLHPKKKNRPLACGQISTAAALTEAVIFFAAAAAVSASLSGAFFAVVMVYILLQLSYTFVLKQRVLVDVICIAMGFVIRTGAGAVAINVAISPWLFVCMFTLCLFMGFCKRYNEMVVFSSRQEAQSHRETLISYTPELLGHLITVSAGIAIVAFLLYSVSERTVVHFGSGCFVYTLPVIIYAVFRFAMLSMRGTYSDPTDLILKDRVFQLTVVVWMVLAFVIINWGKYLQGCLESVK